jgi:predicted AAA+ superfamily ATPase
MPKASQSLTGRAHVMTMWPLSQGELRGRKETFLDELMSDPASLTTPEPSRTDRANHEPMALADGFPIAIARPTQVTRDRWFRDFVDLVVERDVLEIRRVRQRRVLPLILRYLAAQTGSRSRPGRRSPILTSAGCACCATSLARISWAASC